MTSKKYVLITGGSAGLGKELVIQCASIGLNVIIIALPSGSLRSLARQIGLEFGVDIVIIELNLTDQPLLIEQLEYIKKNYKVNFLINNAGTGGTAELLSSSLNYIDNIVQLNVRAMTTVTSLMVPHLIENEESYIMNISSMAAFSPIAYKTVYPASKAFISSFSLGLREELKAYRGINQRSVPRCDHDQF